MYINRDKITTRFNQYVQNYNTADPKIALKIAHSYRVAALSEQIAKDCGIESVDPEIAWAIGMLHDIGRFEQIKRYNTFNDSDSVDHAMLGADILFKDGLLNEFGNFPDKQISTLETAIRNHSLYRIEDGITSETLEYCKIIRDADKVDIFRVNCETPFEDIYNVSTYELKNSKVSEKVKQCYMEKHAVLRMLKETAVDNVVGHLCLAFELEYQVSKEILKSQGYADKLLNFESENEEAKEWFEYMKKTYWNSVFEA